MTLHLFVVMVAMLTAGAIWLNTVDTPLPYPAQTAKVVDLDPDLIPNPSPLEGPYAPNDLLLRHAHRLFDGVINAAETVAMDPDGNLTMVDRNGYLFEGQPAYKVEGAVMADEFALDPRPMAYVGPGRPLGTHFDAANNLYICDALKGLLKLDVAANKLTVLSNRVSSDAAVDPGSPINFCNDLDIATSDSGAHGKGTIYFTDSQSITVGLNPETGAFYDTFRSFLLGLLSGKPDGRLLRYDPAEGSTEVLARGIWYANGVALAHDGSFVAVVESNRLRVLRYWLAGPQTGTTDVLIERLPGIPDGISRASDGNFWVALVAPLGPLPTVMRFKAARVLLAYLPAWARPPMDKWGAVLKVSSAGKPLQLLMDPKGEKVAFVSAVTEHLGRLYFGNIVESYVSYVDLANVNSKQ